MAQATYLSAVEYTGPELTGITDLTITFPYLRTQDVYVLIDEVVTTAWSFFDSATVRLDTPLAGTEVVRLQRSTRIDQRMVDWQDGSYMNEHDLNLVTKQLLYLIQELDEFGVILIDGGEGGAGDHNGTGLTLPEIDNLIDELLSRQTFLNLIELIDITDINAELIINEQLRNHQQWLLNENFEYVLGETGTKVEVLETQRVDDQEAYAAYQVTVAARFDDAEASITTLDETTASQGLAIAQHTLDLQAKVPYDELGDLTEDYIVLSAYVNGVKATATSNEATIEGIESYLVGIGDFQNPELGSLGDIVRVVSILQTEVTGNANALSTELSWRQSMASYFNASATDGLAMAAAIQDKWETYADEGSTTATRVSKLEASTRPIYFRPTFPNPHAVEFEDTNYSTVGFPVGSIWYKQLNGGIRPFIFASALPVPVPGDWTIGVDFFSTGVGFWLPATDLDLEATMGAAVEQVEEAIVGPGGSIATFTTQLSAAYGGNITTIEEWLESYIKPPTNPNDPSTGGIMYSGFGLRANQTRADGQAVIAGFGFGVQSDPWNPESESVSDFIVMANNFAVVKPPSVGTILTGVLNNETVSVPFIVDADTGNVAINGNLFVRGTLKAYEGGLYDITAGQVEVGQMNSDVELSNPSGFRLGLYSSTDNNWSSSAASPFVGGSNPQKYLIWAGTGVKNHNNAVFYVDTDGNGYFDGQVAADNIDGDLSTVDIISLDTGTEKTANHLDNPVWLLYSNAYPNPNTNPIITNATGRARRATAIVNVDMHGDGAPQGRCVLEMRAEKNALNSNVWTPWYRVADATVAQPTGTYQTLIGSMPHTNDTPGGKCLYRVELRVGILRLNGSSPVSQGYSGIALFVS